MPDDGQYGVLIIGAGHIGRAHAEAWRAHSRVAVRAVADIAPGRAEEVAAAFEIETALTDYRAALLREDVQIAAVCTPPDAHCEPTVDALRAGKHVVCEKPFALRVAEAERMVAAAREAGRHLTMASARARYTAAAQKARALVEGGELGRVYHGRSTHLRQRGRPGIDMLQDATWFVSRERAGGGALIDIGVYEIDLMLWLMGSPRVLCVCAAIRHGVGEPPPASVIQNVEDHAALFCLLEGGASLALEIAWASNATGQNARIVLGEQAGLRFNPLTLVAAPEPGTRACREVRLLEGEDSEGGGLPGLVQGMVEALDGGPPPMTPAEDALQVMRVIDAAYRSAAEGRPVEC